MGQKELALQSVTTTLDVERRVENSFADLICTVLDIVKEFCCDEGRSN